MKWASGVFAIAWMMRMRAIKNRERLRETRADNLEVYKSKIKILKSTWKRIKNSRRVVVHIPSLGYTEDIRAQMYNFHVEQNNQIARICSISDPNVDVIYVSPITVTDEAKQYYQKLLSLKKAIDSGNMNDITDMNTRITFVVPEVISHFGVSTTTIPHKKNLCLSSMLRYSPNALQRIQRLIKGRDAYIVPGMVHVDDLEVARILDIPILGSEPQVAQLYSTKSGAKRIFENAGVSMPPGDYDIYSSDQMHETISQLIINNLDIKRWLFKFNSSVSSNGIAYCDITKHLTCYSHVMKEKARYGKEWCHKWAHESSFHQVFSEIPRILRQHACPLNRILYPNWESFKVAFLNEGGIIEAYPRAESVTVLQADMMIEPDGHTQLLCIGDQISESSAFKPWGISVPQSSIDSDYVNSVCQKVAASCQSRNIIGHLSLTMVTFISEETVRSFVSFLQSIGNHVIIIKER
ncbi:IQ domain-containing protein H [Acanthosepion pharaonis]|uniref:IQ domain-containing protein H n=1 Tax=Acanthosepion pharaonis TaxID=158019 RepID=A0A812AST8_ACAPH|nr:IQ domain-containing protein H [Sepia pharaonis]